MRAPIIVCIIATLVGASVAACRKEVPSWPTKIEDLKPNWP